MLHTASQDTWSVEMFTFIRLCNSLDGNKYAYLIYVIMNALVTFGPYLSFWVNSTSTHYNNSSVSDDC